MNCLNPDSIGLKWEKHVSIGAKSEVAELIVDIKIEVERNNVVQRSWDQLSSWIHLIVTTFTDHAQTEFSHADNRNCISLDCRVVKLAGR